MKSATNQRGFTMVEMMIVVAIIGLLASVAYPQFLRYQVKSRQAEVKANLAGIFVAERAYFSEFLRFGGIPQIGFSLGGFTNRYTYRTVSTDSTGAASPQPGDVINPATGPATPENTTYAADSGLGGFTATATANIDNDPTIDEWYVNDLKQDLQQATTDDLIF